MDFFAWIKIYFASMRICIAPATFYGVTLDGMSRTTEWQRICMADEVIDHRIFCLGDRPDGKFDYGSL